MIEVHIDYAPAIDALKRAAAAMADARPLMRSVAGIMQRAVEDNFARQGRPAWQDLHPGTKAGRVKQGTWPGKILQRSGRLAASVVQRSDAASASVGTNVAYAAIQQLGGRTRAHVIRPRDKRALSFGGIVVRQVNHPGSNIPARPFLALTPADLEDVAGEARRHLARALERSRPAA